MKLKFMRRLTAAVVLIALTGMLVACSTVERIVASSTAASSGGMFTPLNLAVKDGNIAEVERLLAEGEVSPNEAANYGSGVEHILVGNLSLAVNYNEDPVPMVKMLLEAGTDPIDDFPAIHDAIVKGNLEVVELLAQYGADVDSGLQSAVMFDQVDIVRMLLNYGADPNMGVSMATMTYNADMVTLLEEAGATIDRRPRHETHPEDYIKTEDGGFIRVH